nr:MAG TPA: hypothetical protein [Caudoviricetes sp.]
MRFYFCLPGKSRETPSPKIKWRIQYAIAFMICYCNCLFYLLLHLQNLAGAFCVLCNLLFQFHIFLQKINHHLINC